MLKTLNCKNHRKYQNNRCSLVMLTIGTVLGNWGGLARRDKTLPALWYIFKKQNKTTDKQKKRSLWFCLQSWMACKSLNLECHLYIGILPSEVTMRFSLKITVADNVKHSPRRNELLGKVDVNWSRVHKKITYHMNTTAHGHLTNRLVQAKKYFSWNKFRVEINLSDKAERCFLLV